MLQFFTGTDREKTRGEMSKAVESAARNERIVRITDANSVHDLETALRGAGMFGEKRIIVLESVFQNEEMRKIMLASLDHIRKSAEQFFIFEEKLDAETRKAIEKRAEKSERFDTTKGQKSNSIFALANAFRRADKKALWVGYQRELAHGEEAEAIHGVLFWGAKDMFLKSRDGSTERRRATKLVAELAELPHEARRNNFQLEYALERFILSVA